MRAFLGGVSPKQPCLRARTADERYEGGSKKGRCEVRVVWYREEGLMTEEWDGGDRDAGSEAEK